MDVFTASLRSACSLRRGHFVNNLTCYLFSIIQSLLFRPGLMTKQFIVQ
ncbi:gluconate 5-dehydrogenase [Yersinia pseudotuberculosis]